MSLTASRPSSTSLTARTDLSIQADQEDPETKEPTFPDKEGIYYIYFGYNTLPTFVLEKKYKIIRYLYRGVYLSV